MGWHQTEENNKSKYYDINNKQYGDQQNTDPNEICICNRAYSSGIG